MKIDHSEITALQAADPGHRFDIYAGIHKAIRLMMTETLTTAGQADVEDDDALQQTCDRVLALADFCQFHLEHENEYIHPAIDAVTPGASDKIAHEHLEHEGSIRLIRENVSALKGAPPAQRPAQAPRLYHLLGLFVAHNFEHMHEEETAHNAVLWQHYSDEQILDIHHRLVASVPPQVMAHALRYMLPAMRTAERVAVMQDIRANAPQPAFEGLMSLAREVLKDSQWAKLASALGVPVVPGLVA